jgi:hypothetical protein
VIDLSKKLEWLKQFDQAYNLKNAFTYDKLFVSLRELILGKIFPSGRTFELRFKTIYLFRTFIVF